MSKITVVKAIQYSIATRKTPLFTKSLITAWLLLFKIWVIFQLHLFNNRYW